MEKYVAIKALPKSTYGASTGLVPNHVSNKKISSYSRQAKDWVCLDIL